MKILASIFAATLVWMAVPASAQVIDGDWSITAGEYSGGKVPQKTLGEMSLKVERNSFDAKSGDSVSKGKVTNTSRSQPPQLVFKIDSGADAGREVKAIYELKNGILKIAFSSSESFPSDFSSTKENKSLVLTYKNNARKTSGPPRSRGRGGDIVPLGDPQVQGFGG